MRSSRGIGSGFGWWPGARIAAPVMVAAALAVLVAGCTGAGAGGLAGTDAAPVPASTFDPLDPLLVGSAGHEVSDGVDLVGAWQISGAEREAPGTFVWIDGGGAIGQTVTVFRDCGPLFVEWTGTSSALATGSVGGAQECFLGPEGDQPQPIPEIPWLTEARGFRVAAEGIELLDANDGVLARLDPAVGEPADASEWRVTGPPVVDDETRRSLRVRAPLASGLVAVTAAEIVGTWTPVGLAEGATPETPSTYPAAAPKEDVELPDDWPEQATITFRADGHFTVDDCRSVSAPSQPEWEGHRWFGDGTGFWVASYGVNLLLCSPSWPGWDARTRTIALDNGYLRLFDVDGNELGRLERVG